MQRPARHVALAVLLGSVLCSAPAAARRISVEVEVRDLAGGPALRAASAAELSWTAAGGPAALQDIREWEAFLSLDGGATYPVRITPHLDVAVRRVLWQVPPTPTQAARLLLRFGDETDETAVELPQLWAIVDAGPNVPVSATIAFHRGESALPGLPGVVLWTEGPRQGGGRQVVAADPLESLGTGTSFVFSGHLIAVFESEEAPGTGDPLAPLPPAASTPPSHPRLLSRPGAPPARSADLLSLLQRRNE